MYYSFTVNINPLGKLPNARGSHGSAFTVNVLSSRSCRTRLEGGLAPFFTERPAIPFQVITLYHHTITHGHCWLLRSRLDGDFPDLNEP